MAGAGGDVYAHRGARLLIRDLMCLSAPCWLDTLVGGTYWDVGKAGLWYWNVNNTSSITAANIGARLIILVFGV